MRLFSLMRRFLFSSIARSLSDFSLIKLAFCVRTRCSPSRTVSECLRTSLRSCRFNRCPHDFFPGSYVPRRKQGLGFASAWWLLFDPFAVVRPTSILSSRKQSNPVSEPPQGVPTWSLMCRSGLAVIVDARCAGAIGATGRQTAVEQIRPTTHVWNRFRVEVLTTATIDQQRRCRAPAWGLGFLGSHPTQLYTSTHAVDCTAF